MRLIGHLLEESVARTFADYLYVQGIENQLEFVADEGWCIWVVDEDQIEKAIRLLDEFRKNSSNPKYHGQASKAAELRNKEAKTQDEWVKKQDERRHLFRPLRDSGFGVLTVVLIVACLGVFLLSKMGADIGPIGKLFISEYSFKGSSIAWYDCLPEVRHGQVWRLFTPMLIHFNLLHVFFNMLWLRELGSMIEGRQNTWVLGALVLGIAAVSNLAQFIVTLSPLFGGMSGVVYGLLGYIWLRGKFDPGSGLFVHPTTVTMMLIWLVVCFTGWLGPVANAAHVAGLVTGMVWGWLSSLRYR